MRKLNLLLLVACALCAIKASAYDFAVDGIYYALNEDSTTVSVTYETTSYGSYSGDVSIPSTVTYNGVTYTVNALGISSFRLCSGLTSLTLGDSVKTIKDYAFYQFSTSSATGITDFTIPSSITTIGPYAFQGCTGLKSVVIPDNVTVIDKYAFNSCSSVMSLTISSNLAEMGVYAFGNCKALTSIAIPGKLSEISERAFYNCTSLVSVTIGEGVTRISNYAFSTCSALSSISIPSTLEEIGSQVFYKCTSLDSIDLPQGITTIGSYAFNYCSALTSVSLPSSLTSLGDGAFAHSGLTSIVFPSSLNTLNTNMLNGCTALTSVSLPDSLEEIGSNTFYGCVALSSITIPETVKGIDGSAFYNCSTLTAIELPEKLEFIGTKAFYSCAAVTEITIPETVDSIATYAFQRCYALKSATIPEGITELRMGLFYDCIGLETVSLPSTLTTIGQSVFRNCSTLTAITIPEKVVSASNYAFYNCTGLTEVNSLNSSPPTLSTSPFATATYSAATLYVPTGCKDTYAAATYWSNFTNIEEKDFSATTADYTITTAAEWNALAELMATDSLDLTGKVVLIANDIDFTGDTIKPLGYDMTTYFNGELDGNGKTIKGINATATATYFGGIITTACDSAYIHDLTVEGDVVSDYQYTGGIIGKLAGKLSNVTSGIAFTTTAKYCAGVVGYVDDNGTLTDCVNAGTVTTSTSYGAGVVGYGSAGVTYENCGNRGTLIYTGTSATSYCGGVFAYIFPATVTCCYNEGVVKASDAGGGLSGVIASAHGTNTTGTFYIKACYNSGEVTSYYNNAGVVLTGSAYTKVVMENCYNSGTVTSTYTDVNNSTYTAGVSARYFRTSTYRNCWNSGKVISYGPSYVSGVIGYYKGTGSETATTTIVGCYNTGTVECPKFYVGGIVGIISTYTYIDSCWNTGNVTGGYYCGGIVGQMGGSYTSVTNSWNAGTVTASSSRCGGIAGNATSKSVTISNCFNTGSVISTSETQGTTDGTSGTAIGGIVGQCGCTLTNVYNVGSVTGVSRVGGLVGASNKTSTAFPDISYGYSIGKINAPSDTCGNILGSSVYNGTIWSTSSSISNTYYLSENDATAGSGTARDTASVGLSYAELAKLDLGDSWTAGDNYTYPRLTTLADNDYARAYAAAVIPADGDSYSSITTGFNVGTPDGVTWTASSGSVEIDGNNVTFSESFSGTLTMTATSGDVSVATELTCNVTVTGISDITGGSREVVSERFYNLAGAQVAEPTDGAKAIYIVVKSYSDGTTETVKEVR